MSRPLSYTLSLYSQSIDERFTEIKNLGGEKPKHLTKCVFTSHWPITISIPADVRPLSQIELGQYNKTR